MAPEPTGMIASPYAANAPLRHLAGQFLRYVVVGGLAFVVDYALLFVMTEYAGLHYLVSASIGFACGLLASYLLCIGWIFPVRALDSRGREFGAFALIGIAGLGLNNGLMFAATEWAGVHYLISKLLAAALVLIFNFGLRRHFLFSNRARPIPVRAPL